MRAGLEVQRATGHPIGEVLPVKETPYRYSDFCHPMNWRPPKKQKRTAIHYQPKETRMSETPAPTGPESFTLVLSPATVNLIGEALGELPQKRSGALHNALVAECAKQTEAWHKAQQTPAIAFTDPAALKPEGAEVVSERENQMAKELKRTANPEDEQPQPPEPAKKIVSPAKAAAKKAK